MVSIVIRLHISSTIKAKNAQFTQRRANRERAPSLIKSSKMFVVIIVDSKLRKNDFYWNIIDFGTSS
jgi:hypothetical protein